MFAQVNPLIRGLVNTLICGTQAPAGQGTGEVGLVLVAASGGVP
jgi:hypothetical protein